MFRFPSSTVLILGLVAALSVSAPGHAQSSKSAAAGQLPPDAPGGTAPAPEAEAEVVTGDYLDSQPAFDQAWAKLREKMGDADLYALTIDPTRIQVQTRPRDGGTQLDGWTVERTSGLFARTAVTGPVPTRPSGPVLDLETGYFAQSDLPLDRLLAILDQAEPMVPLAQPGRVTNLRIARQLSFGAQLSMGDVRWSVRVDNGHEWGTVQVSADGTLLGADISRTLRGQNRNFLTQADWPFDAVERGFDNIFGGGETIYEIKALSHGIEVTAQAAEAADKVVTYRWNGGMFTRHSFGLAPNVELLRPSGNLPFDMASAGLARLPAILAAASAAVPGACGTVDRAKAVRPRPASGDARTVWVVELKADPNASETCVVEVGADASIVSSRLPPSQSAPEGYLSGAGMLAGIAGVQAGFGADAPVFELTFRPDRVDVNAPDPADPSMTVNLSLGTQGLRHGMGFPMMMQTQADLIPLTRMAALDPAVIDRIMAEAVQRIGLPGAEVYRMKIWSGQPFWRAPDGMPLVDVRVGVPPNHNAGGYVVFTLDGQFVETLK